jgi:hypothetical protein
MMPEPAGDYGSIQTAAIYRGRWLTNVSMRMVVMEGEIQGLSCL